MICRFCQQWNPNSTKLCCFCQNQIDATDDATVSNPRGAHRPSASIASVPTSQDTLKSVPLWQIGAGMGTAIVLLLLLKMCL